MKELPDDGRKALGRERRFRTYIFVAHVEPPRRIDRSGAFRHTPCICIGRPLSASIDYMCGGDGIWRTKTLGLYDRRRIDWKDFYACRIDPFHTYGIDPHSGDTTHHNPDWTLGFGGAKPRSFAAAEMLSVAWCLRVAHRYLTGGWPRHLDEIVRYHVYRDDHPLHDDCMGGLPCWHPSKPFGEWYGIHPMIDRCLLSMEGVEP